MKKTSKLTAILAIGALALSGLFLSCSNGDSDSSSSASPSSATINNNSSVSQGKLTGTWDLTTITSLSGVSSDGKSVLSADVTVPATENGGATLTLLANSKSKPKFNSGLQSNTSSSAFEIAKVGGYTGGKVTVTCKNATTKATGSSGSVNAVEISFGDKSFKWTDGTTVTDSEQELSYTLTSSDVIISGSGVKITKIVVE